MQVDTTVLGLDAERAKDLPYIASMGIYVISKEALIRFLSQDFTSANDFGSEVIPGACAKGSKVGLPSFVSLSSYLPFPLPLFRLCCLLPPVPLVDAGSCGPAACP